MSIGMNREAEQRLVLPILLAVTFLATMSVVWSAPQKDWHDPFLPIGVPGYRSHAGISTPVRIYINELK